MQIHTVGHSNRAWGDFVAILARHSIKTLVDVRSLPGSRTWPHFNRQEMERTLPESGIAYLHLASLGGRRKADKTTTNAGWEHRAFKAYADHALTPEFKGGLDALLERESVAIMCAEAVPWRCHRRIIGDHLVARGIDVIDIIGLDNAEPHRMTPFARSAGGVVTYPLSD
jgi:uncharacterized protein (DUF488 family)